MVWGTDDRLTPPAHYATLWAAAIPQATTVAIEGGGHMVHIERAVETAQAIEAALATNI